MHYSAERGAYERHVNSCLPFQFVSHHPDRDSAAVAVGCRHGARDFGSAREKFYIFSVRQADNSTVFLRIADPHKGTSLHGVDAENLVYDTMKEAYFRNLQVQVGYRDFGPDPQAGIENLTIDRVILTQ